MLDNEEPGLELQKQVPIINKMMENAGLHIVVNIVDSRYGKIWGNENNGTKKVTMLYLSYGHFELLEEHPHTDHNGQL